MFLNTLHRDLRLLLEPPDGTKEHPATTCLELWLCHPYLTNGFYYIDPNQGSPADAFAVYCNFTAGVKTCLSARNAQVPEKAWLKDTGSGETFHWLSTLENGFEFEYPGASVVQLRFLRLYSRSATQNVTYSCTPGSIQSHQERKVHFLADTRKHSYLRVLNDCEHSDTMQSGLRESVFHFDSEDLDLLPLRDLAVFGGSNFTQKYGFTIGPVCFC
ncbi:collagen alpha-1(II) chain-like [Brienomyrus brachyistius]|uniref:collagen alpha-1(II) chain-like n=1 Tax=Brienomyrus brachyistius TaxID=42636 RepID=UPI0020B40B12|nr:collagen alpha-1(II) chain-like [Brienomyrus brachyistius]